MYKNGNSMSFSENMKDHDDTKQNLPNKDKIDLLKNLRFIKEE